MIPTFPEFKKLEIHDKDEFENIIKKYPQYSDFNFVSLWSYNVNDECEISLLKGNLVLKMTDYTSDNPVFTFLGSENIDETIESLRRYLDQHHFPLELKLIPEVVIQSAKENNNFIIEEDHDNHDYILSVEEHVRLEGKSYHKRRNLIKKIIASFGDDLRIELEDIANSLIQEDVRKIFHSWQESRNKNPLDTEHELLAIEKLFSGLPIIQPSILIARFKDNPIGFSIFEPTFFNHGVIHFEKADTSYTGIFEYLTHQTAIVLREKGCEFINYEQDLGIEGLRRTKQLHRPVLFLKKFKIHFK